jgi:hypothetical protein
VEVSKEEEEKMRSWDRNSKEEREEG